MQRWMWLLLVLTSGCGGPATGTITGTVNYGTEPVPMGTISFRSSDESELPITVGIENGRFTAPNVPVGVRKVVINGFTGDPRGAAGGPMFPFNAPGTTSEMTVQPGPQEKHFVIERPAGK
jgi:hypothetical protein